MSVIAAYFVFAQKPNEDFAATWKTIESAIRTRYYARTTREKEMEALLKEYGPLASTSINRETFSRIVNQMIDDFKDSHFGFTTRADQTFYVMDGLANAKEPASMPHFGAWFKKTADGYTVQMVLNASDAEQKDLRKGDVVVSVDDQPFSPVLSLQNKIGKDVKLSIRRGSSMISKTLHVESQPMMEAFLEASRESKKVLPQNGRNIGYFHLWTQAQEPFKASLASAVYGALSKTDAMILDLRDGFGGRPEGYADPFFRPEVNLEWKYSEELKLSQPFGYQRPLVVLINGGSRSAKEVLSFILKTSKRATLIGSPTAGNVLGTFPQKIGDWAYLEIPMVDVFANGVRLENNGVKPNITVPVEFDESGKDLVLAAALKFLESVPKYRAK